jgi:hypothetical protein
MATPRVALAARVREEDEAQKKKCMRKKLGKVEAAWLMNLYDAILLATTVSRSATRILIISVSPASQSKIRPRA